MLKTLYLIAIVALCSLGNVLHAQNLSGKWYGVGYVQLEGSTDSYLAELIINQEGKQVKGEFNYYFKDKFFKNRLEGSFDKATRVLTIKRLPVIFYRSNDSKKSVESFMSGSFELRVSKVVSVLNGLLMSAPENQYIVPNIKYRFLRSMGEPIDTTAEEPAPLQAYQEKPKALMNAQKNVALSQDKQTGTSSSISTSTTTSTSTSTPIPISTPIPTPIPIPTSTSTKTSTKTSATTSAAGIGIASGIGKVTGTATSASTTASTPSSTTASTTASVAASIPIIETRKKTYFKEIELENSKIQVELYDNGTIDYDSVSLHLNGKEVLVKTMLNHKSIKLTLQLDPDLAFNELAMFAENLGMIPPNTAAMIIHDGKKEYQVLLQSDLSTSATIKLSVKKNIP